MTKKVKKKEWHIKISTIIGILLGLDLILLALMSLNINSNPEIIKVFSDVAKVLAGALAGAVAGERYEK